MRYILALCLIFYFVCPSFAVLIGMQRTIDSEEMLQNIYPVPNRVEVFKGDFCDTKSSDTNVNSFDGMMYVEECKKFKDLATIRNCEPIGMSINFYWEKIIFYCK